MTASKKIDGNLRGSSLSIHLDRLRAWSIVLAALGALDSLYLTYIKLAHARAALCAAGGGCDTVNTSPYSEIAGIPIAMLGFLAYVVILSLLLLESRAGIRSPSAVPATPLGRRAARDIRSEPVLKLLKARALAGDSHREDAVGEHFSDNLSDGRQTAEYLRLAVFGLSLSGVLYSAYLTYLELFVLRAICLYCVLSALLLLALLALSMLRLRHD